MVPSHGGARRGSGRPPLPESQRRVAVTVRVLPETRDKLAALAAAADLSQADIVDALVRAASL
jgi:hypothetical protein